MTQNPDDLESFFKTVSPVNSLDEAVDTSLHVDVPGHWWVVVADVTGSTQAIAEGHYKQVNTVGVACMAAVMNLDRSVDLPYVFGGDGVTMAIPPRLRDAALPALRGAQRLARDAFGLDLRVGLVQVSALQRHDARVRVTRLRLSANLDLPVFSGRGWEEAERWVKAGDVVGVLYLNADDDPAEADFSGFECRWQNVPARHGVKLSLIVLGCSPDPAINQHTIAQTLEAVGRFVGQESASHPLDLQGLQVSFSPMGLMGEPMVRTYGEGRWAFLRYAMKLLFLNLAAVWVFFRDRHRPDSVWGRYRHDLIRQSDHRKFDGALRMVLDTSAERMDRLRQWLEAQREAGLLVYGMHRSSEALITCIVHSYEGKHVHFIDGADGGYALAAREMKAQLKSIKAA